jgi:ferritin-like protein
MSSTSYHEPFESISPEVCDMHRAIVSLMEELEAIDWYGQRANATADEDLSAILSHNRDEEIEHAMMVLEWIRRRDSAFDQHARRYLFTEAPLTQIECNEGEQTTSAGLGIGGLRSKEKPQ